MFLFRSHLRSLLVELLDLNFFRADISFQLLDLVVQNEFKLFKLLNLLLQLLNLNVLFLNRINPRLKLLLTSVDVRFDLLLLDHFVFKLSLLLLQISRFIVSLSVLRGQLSHLLGQLGLILEA